MTAALAQLEAFKKESLLEPRIDGMDEYCEIENYPGLCSGHGPELAEKMFEPLENLGVEHLFVRLKDWRPWRL